MSTAAAPKLYTFEEFCEVIEDGQKADLIDGEIFLSSPDSLRNNKLQNFVFSLLDGYSRRRSPGDVFTSRVAFRLNERSAPEPDVAFVGAAHGERLRAGHVLGGPDIAVEIVSDDSTQRDYVRKRALYQDAGVPEYWVIDPVRGQALFLRLEGEEYEEAGLDEGVFRSEAMPGFWINVNWLFQEPLPDPAACLEQILAG